MQSFITLSMSFVSTLTEWMTKSLNKAFKFDTIMPLFPISGVERPVPRERNAIFRKYNISLSNKLIEILETF